MCQQLTTLARYTDKHLIAQCEHGTCHLTWDRVTVRLLPAECVRLAGFLASWSAESRTGMAFLHDEGFRLFQDPLERVQCWVYNTGFQMTAREVPILCKLVQLAARRLCHAERAIGTAPVSPTLADSCEVPTVSTAVFSAN